jgi:hypothetical protein
VQRDPEYPTAHLLQAVVVAQRLQLAIPQTIAAQVVPVYPVAHLLQVVVVPQRRQLL